MPNPFRVVQDLEQALCDYTGAPYCVCVDSCTSAILLSLELYKKEHPEVEYLEVPKHTYCSIPMSVIHAGFKIKWVDELWEKKGEYRIKPSNIIDSAKKIHRNMYRPGEKRCLSFHMKKVLPIGRGGCILIDNEDEYKWLKLARYDGREEKSLHEQHDYTVLGYNVYLTPDSAARGLWKLLSLEDYPKIEVEYPPYKDLSKMTCFKEHAV
jgi:dTDP-4-amino-4,6-dideoxygalactose transaminase